MIKTKDPFLLEHKRHLLAKNGRFVLLKKTYVGKMPEIKDINTGVFWDRQFRRVKTLKEEGPMAKERVNVLFKWVKGRKGRLLDVGFGRGYLEQKLAKVPNLLVFGIDISRTAIKSASSSLAGAYRVGSILKIPFPDSYFSVVIASEVLEHISPSKIFKALKEVKRVLKNSGLFIVSVPLNEGLEQLLKKGLNPNGHLRIYTLPLIEAELKIAGFKIIERRLLFAFRNLYTLKKLLLKYLLNERWRPNNIVILAEI